MELENILKYQQIDGELRKLKREIAADDNSKIAEQAKRQFNEKKQVVVKSEAIAAKVYGGYAESVKHYEETVKRAESLMAKLAGDNLSEEEAEEIAAQLEALKAKMSEITEYIYNIKKKGEDAVREFSDAQKSGQELKNKYNKAKTALSKLEEQYKPRIAELETALKEARKNVSDQTFELYKKITTEDKIFPAFAEVYDDGAGTVACSRCGYALPLSEQSVLKQNGYCTCACHRIIYYKNSGKGKKK